jgi:hypothetical protein
MVAFAGDSGNCMELEARETGDLLGAGKNGGEALTSDDLKASIGFPASAPRVSTLCKVAYSFNKAMKVVAASAAVAGSLVAGAPEIVMARASGVMAYLSISLGGGLVGLSGTMGQKSDDAKHIVMTGYNMMEGGVKKMHEDISSYLKSGSGDEDEDDSTFSWLKDIWDKVKDYIAEFSDEDDGGVDVPTPPPSEDALLMVSKQGEGAGTIMSYPPGITCPGSCTHAFPIGTKVTLGARLDSSDSVFAGWQGACTDDGYGDCIIYLEEDTAIIGTFDKGAAPPPNPPSGGGQCGGMSNSNECGSCSSNSDCGGSRCYTSMLPAPFC